MKANLDGHIGEWIAICGRQIISSGKDAKAVFREARRKFPGERLLFARVPEKETMIFGL